jgi:heme-degrading monooxygenase HmoA
MVDRPPGTSAHPAALAAFAATPEPPYFAVIFTSVRRREGDGDAGADAAYARTAAEMERLAREQAGFLGVESARDAAGLGITVSYWSSLEAIAAWRAHGDHRMAQRVGRTDWYGAYALRVCEVTSARVWAREGPSR